MKKQFVTKQNLVKAFGGVLFFGVFILNIMLFVQKDSKTDTLSLRPSEASAQMGGAEAEDAYERKIEEVDIQTDMPCFIFPSDPTEPFSTGINTQTISTTHCEGSGNVECKEDLVVDETECMPLA